LARFRDDALKEGALYI